MQKLAACLLLLLVAICAYGQQLQDLGTVSLPSTIDAIGIVSQEFKVCFLQKICKICKTDLIIETSTDNTFSVAIKANGLSGKNAQQLVKVVGNNITITATAANLANHGASSSVLTTLACFALVPLVTRSKFSIVLILALVAMIVSQIHAQSSLNKNITIAATLRIPASVTLKSFYASIDDGTLTVKTLNALSFDARLCSGIPDVSSIVNVDNLSVRNSVNVCSKQEVTFTNLFFSSTRVLMNVNTEKDVTVTFKGGFVGQYQFEGSTNTFVSGDCQQRSAAAGTCGDGRHSSVLIKTQGKVTGSFGKECDAGYLNREGTDFSNTNTQIQSSIPGNTITMTNVSNWYYTSAWGTQSAQLSTNGTGFLVHTGAWTRNMFWVVNRTPLPNLRNEGPLDVPNAFLYTVQFNIWRNWRADFRSNVTNITVAVINTLNTNMEDDYITRYPTRVIASARFADFTVPAQSFVTKSISFKSPSITATNIYLAIQIQSVDGANQMANLFILRDVQFIVPARNMPTQPTLITTPSETITTRKPAVELDANPRSDCPFAKPNLKLWQDPATWGGAVPNPAQTITLPESTSVLVTSCSFDRSAVYEKIVVPATSELIFADAPIKLNIKAMHVQGKLLIGSPTCRLNSYIDIVFFGKKADTTPIIMFGMGMKGIGVDMQGTIEMHGKQYHYTWTRLAAEVFPGDNHIYVQDDVNWEVGQKVVVVTTLRNDEQNNQNEVMTIKALSGRLIQFEEYFKFNHYASNEYQAEVGLLSRRITLSGNEADSVADMYGGHVMVMGKGRIAGVATVRMGQQNSIARYPLHFHMMGVAPDSYIRDCSFFQDFYRCIAIHGTHNATFERNVAFDVHGHCYYIEDGVEENNTIAYNLAAFVHPIGTPADGGGSQGGVVAVEAPNLRQPADITASGYYITNARNRIIGNAASGGWAGFSFPNLFKPIGLFFNVPGYTTYDPSSKTTLEFDGNSAHSSGYFWTFGSCIYVGGQLFHDTAANNTLRYISGRVSRETRTQIPNEQYTWQSPPLWMKFTNTKTFLCQDGIGHWGSRIEVQRYEGFDIRRAATLFGEAWFDSAVVVGRTRNINGVPMQQGFQYYDTWVKTIITNIVFKNFVLRPGYSTVQDDNRAIISMTHSDQFKPQGISAARNIRYENMDRKQIIGHRIQDTGSSRYYNFVDWDGTASLRGKPAIVGSHKPWWKLDNTCTYENDWNVWTCDKTPQREIGNIDIVIPGLVENTNIDPPQTIGKTCLFGGDVGVEDRCSEFTRNLGVTGATGVNWFLHVDSGVPKNFNLNVNLVPFGTSILFAIRYPAGTQFNVTASYQYNNQHNSVFTSAASLAALRSGNGKQFFFDGTYLYLKVVNHMLTGASSEYFERGGVRIYTILLGYRYFITSSCTTVSGSMCAAQTFALPSGN